jgi:segregation and condensation protein B
VDFSADFVEGTIEELNALYAAEGRPYDIRLGEGGYRMALRSEFDAVRNRVFGVGPREVRLSQEALEVLSLVAYRQPISRTEVEATGRDNAGNVLRQLLRRELVTIQRGEKGRDDVRYLTTPRFLELFGLGRIDELPRADELEMK